MVSGVRSVIVKGMASIVESSELNKAIPERTFDNESDSNGVAEIEPNASENDASRDCTRSPVDLSVDSVPPM